MATARRSLPSLKARIRPTLKLRRTGKRRLAGLTRLELATFRVTGGRSNQLSYSSPTILIEWLLEQDSNLRPND